MSLASFSLSEPAVAQGANQAGAKAKAPPKRQAVALADRTLVPEPR